MGIILIDSESRAWDMVAYLDNHYLSHLVPTFPVVKPSCQKSSYLDMTDLPLELTHYILSYWIDWAIKECKFMEVIRLIYRHNYLLTKYYKRYVGEPIETDGHTMDMMFMRNALYWVFNFAESIFTDTLFEKNVSKDNAFYFELTTEWKFKQVNCSPRKMFNKFHFSCMPLGDFDRLDHNDGLLALCQGDRFCDVVWFNGNNVIRSSTFEYTSKECPVIVLAITDIDHCLMTVKKAKKIQGWSEFVNLLHYIGGKDTSVYFCESLVDDEFVLKKFV